MWTALGKSGNSSNVDSTELVPVLLTVRVLRNSGVYPAAPNQMFEFPKLRVIRTLSIMWTWNMCLSLTEREKLQSLRRKCGNVENTFHRSLLLQAQIYTETVKSQRKNVDGVCSGPVKWQELTIFGDNLRNSELNYKENRKRFIFIYQVHSGESRHWDVLNILHTFTFDLQLGVCRSCSEEASCWLLYARHRNSKCWFLWMNTWETLQSREGKRHKSPL